MMKKILIALAVLVGSSAFAGPALTADPYPATAPQPTSITLTANGSAVTGCNLAAGAAGALIPTCDLASLAVPGTYTLVMTAVFAKGCVTAANAATCTDGGSASSVPFALTLRAAPAVGPTLRVAP